MKLQNREKALVAGIPLLIATVLIWSLWFSPRLLFHHYVQGSWRDYAKVQRHKTDDDTVISFQPTSQEAINRIIKDMKLRPGMPGGNMGEVTDSTLTEAGFSPTDFQSYHDSERTIDRGLFYLFVGSRRSVIVVILY